MRMIRNSAKRAAQGQDRGHALSQQPLGMGVDFADIDRLSTE